MEEQELVEDLVQIVNVFYARLQGKRANKAKKMIRELLESDSVGVTDSLRIDEWIFKK